MPLTPTPRLGLAKPDPNPTTGDFLDVTVLNANADKLDTAAGAFPCTAGTRPGSPWHGMLIRETDTRRVLVWNATQGTWDPVNGAIIAASGSRPSTPGSGIFIRETDTRRILIWNASENVWDLVADPLAEYGAWSTYVPVWTAATTNPSLGDGTIQGRYRVLGKSMDIWIKLLWGSTTSSASTGGWRFTVPFAIRADQLLQIMAEDASASQRWTGSARIIGGTTGDNMRTNITSGGGQIAGVSTPFTWATGDMLILQGSVELS